MDRSEHTKIGVFALTALVLGSMIGGGVFNLPKDMAANAGGLAIILGWIVTAIGMIALSLCFNNLAIKLPELDGGIYNYARAGFGEYIGFNSAFGYWISAVVGNVAYGTLLMSSLGYFFPIFAGGQNLASIIGASIMLWLVHYLILQGIKTATLVNLVVTIAKLIPLFLFIIVMIFVFHIRQFNFNFLGDSTTLVWSEIGKQLKSTMLVTVWVFIGMEGAVIFSSRAKKRTDIGRATVLGLLGTIVLYILVTLLSLGLVPRESLIHLPNPSIGYLLALAIGPVGAYIINIGLIISVLGAWLNWTLLAAETPYLAAESKVFPRWFGKLNDAETPTNSLWASNMIIQFFLIIMLFSQSAYTFAYSMAATCILIPYALSAFYQVKFTSHQEKSADRTRNLIYGYVAGAYGIWLLYASGITFLLLMMIVYFIAFFFYIASRKSLQITTPIKPYEWILAIAIIVLALYAIFALFSGQIAI